MSLRDRLQQRALRNTVGVGREAVKKLNMPSDEELNCWLQSVVEKLDKASEKAFSLDVTLFTSWDRTHKDYATERKGEILVSVPGTRVMEKPYKRFFVFFLGAPLTQEKLRLLEREEISGFYDVSRLREEGMSPLEALRTSMQTSMQPKGVAVHFVTTPQFTASCNWHEEDEDEMRGREIDRTLRWNSYCRVRRYVVEFPGTIPGLKIWEEHCRLAYAQLPTDDAREVALRGNEAQLHEIAQHILDFCKRSKLLEGITVRLERVHDFLHNNQYMRYDWRLNFSWSVNVEQEPEVASALVKKRYCACKEYDRVVENRKRSKNDPDELHLERLKLDFLSKIIGLSLSKAESLLAQSPISHLLPGSFISVFWQDGSFKDVCEIICPERLNVAIKNGVIIGGSEPDEYYKAEANHWG